MQVIPIKYQSQFFSLHNYMTLNLMNIDAVIRKLVKIQNQILVVSKCMLHVFRPSFEVVREGRILH